MNPRLACTRWLERRWYGSAPPGPLALALERMYLAYRERRAAARPLLPVAGVPVIVVGNLNIGGTGKTPAVIALGLALQESGYRIGVISRGYGATASSRSRTPMRVHRGGEAQDVGDEPLLLAARLGCPVWVGRDRDAALRALTATEAVDVVLSDDGLQHNALGRTIEICTVDGERGLGNGHCLPAGPLREPSERLARVDFVLAKGTPRVPLPRLDGVMRLRAGEWRVVVDDSPLPLAALVPGTAVSAVAGIACPAQFFASLRALGLAVREYPFPDHHRFGARDFRGMQGRVVMTEKDAVKCRRLAPPGALALRLEAELPAALLEAVRGRLPQPCR